MISCQASPVLQRKSSRNAAKKLAKLLCLERGGIISISIILLLLSLFIIVIVIIIPLPRDGAGRPVGRNFSKELHSDDGEGEVEKKHQQEDVRKGPEALHERPNEKANTVAFGGKIIELWSQL